MKAIWFACGLWLLVFGIAFYSVFALAHGEAEWINRGNYKNPITGELCCGEHDCRQVPPEDVSETRGQGYYIKSLTEIVPRAEVQTSLDGNYWRCHRPDGTRRCFFAPPGAI